MENLNKKIVKILLYKYVAMHPDYFKMNGAAIDHPDFDKLVKTIIKEYYQLLKKEVKLNK